MALPPLNRPPVSSPTPGPSHNKELGKEPGPVPKPEEGAQAQRQQEAEKARQQQQPAPRDSFETSRKQANPADPASKPKPADPVSKPESNQAPQPQPQQQHYGKDERYVSRLEDAYKDLSPKEIKQGGIQDPVKTLADAEQQTLEAILDNLTAEEAVPTA